jgi:two-component system, OmpR family, response regulator TctD
MNTLLVVDGSNAIRAQTVARLLDSYTYCVESVNLQDQAVKAWQSEDFALVIIDWELPNAGGDKLCRRLADDPRRQNCIVLALVPDDVKIMAAALDAGADDWLVRPFIPEHIRLRLRIAQERFMVRWDRTRGNRALGEFVRQNEMIANERQRHRLVHLPVARHRDRDYVIEALERANGNRTAASRLLGISRATLYRRMESLGLS